MAELIVDLTDAKGTPNGDQIKLEFKKDSDGSLTILLHIKKKKGAWNAADPPSLKFTTPTVKTTDAQKVGLKPMLTEIFDGTTTDFSVTCPHPDDKDTKPFISYHGTPYYINHGDQNKVLEQIRKLSLKKKT